ncbi:MAG: hypothetical protein OT477_14080 [Chloroflexi bacterium]|nr:hypothetical protein [Chloroflexota bacterium]
MNFQDMIFAALGMGLLSMGMFLLVKTGIFKSWFVLKTLPGLFSARMFYMALPLGLSFMGLAILPALPNYVPDEMPYTLFAIVIVFGGPIVGFWFMGHPPKWLAPQWLQWLEQEYGYCVDILLEEAQKMNRWAWEAQVRTQEGMQVWIDEVVARRRKEVDFAWEVEKLYRVEQQILKRGHFVFKPGMKIEGVVPAHRQQDIALTREGIDEVFRYRNAPYRKS